MTDVVMPRLSDTMEEGTIARWLKHPGETVTRGEVIAEIDTDKATMDLEAYEDGVLERVLVLEGATASIGEPIAVIAHGGSAPSPQPRAATLSAGAETTRPDGSLPTAVPVPTERRPAAVRQPRSSPLARALARRNGIDISQLQGSGPGGRVVRADVEQAISEALPVPPEDLQPRQPSSTSPAKATLAERPPPADAEEVPLGTIRRLTAQRMTASAEIPQFCLTGIVDAGALLALRAQITQAVAEGEPVPTVTDLLVSACAKALRSHPNLNSSFAGDRLLRHHHINIGVAVATDAGLVVPVVHDADTKSLGELASSTRDLTSRARAGKLDLGDLAEATFTISNMGMYGVDHFTALLNPPQAAILAVGAAQAEPVVRDGVVVAATTMKVSLSVDHRVTDGAGAAQFLADLQRLLEHPIALLL